MPTPELPYPTVIHIPTRRVFGSETAERLLGKLLDILL